MQELSIISLVSNASLVVQGVIGLLLLFSIISWGIIFNKWLSLTQAKTATNKFLAQYSTSNSITNLYTTLNAMSKRTTTAQMFHAGLSEYNRLSKSGIHYKKTINDNIERSLMATVEDQLAHYESALTTLATFGSVSPYLGLFGTVWGIMHAFIGLGNTNQATLAAVAPGIAEALIATAVGLFVAIPAYIAYNKFMADIGILEKKMYKFGDEFLNLINRKLAAAASSGD